MAAKFDGKHARANMWVTQQNLAKQKGGAPGWQYQERKHPKPAPRPGAQSAPTPAPAAPASGAQPSSVEPSR